MNKVLEGILVILVAIIGFVLPYAGPGLFAIWTLSWMG